MLFARAVLLTWLGFAAIATEQPAPAAQMTFGPRFSDFPVAKLYSGPISNPKFRSGSDKHYLVPLLNDIGDGPNFSGQFRLVQFRMGSGPVGAVLVDSKTGSIYRLPHEMVQDDFFIHGTDCLAALRALQWAKASDEEDSSAPLSFKNNSELLVVRQCRADGTAVERTYYRWHGLTWHFVNRLAGPPPPLF
jgi:hypothetical protein